MAQQKAQGTITIIDTTDIESIKNWYLATNASSGIDKTTTGWTDTVQQMSASKQYLWNYEQILGSDNVEISSTQPVIIGHYGINGQNGADGNSITSIDEYYKITNSSTVTSTNPGSTGWTKNSLVVPTVENKYLWNYQVINYSKTAAEGSYSDARIIGVYGDTGPQGPQGVQGPQGETGLQGDTGISVTGTKEIYFLKRTTDNIPTAPADGITTISTSTAGGIWTTVVPNYIEGGIYYTSIQTTYSSGTSPKSSTAVINQGLTDANAKALAAYDTSTARDTEINALQAQAKHYWWDNQGAHVAAGENTTNVNNITQGTPSTYGFNSLMAPGYLALKYKDINFVQLATNSLTFYRPATNDSTYVQGKKGMDLTADALTFYKPLAYNSANEPTAAATLNANGLVLSEGGLEAGTKNTTDYIYLYSTDEPTNHTININNSGNKSDWRIVAGNKFGVDKAGNLYAAGAHIDGDIIAQSLTIGSGANAYSGIAAINITGYSIEIEVADIAGSTETKKLIPHLLHNGENADSEVTDKTDFIWYVDNSTSGIQGDSVDGSIVGTYGSSYQVIYDFDDGAIGGGTATRTLTVDPSKYITRISDTGITIHPEMLTEQSSWIQLDGNGMELFNSSNESIARYGNTAKIGLDASSRFLMNASSLQAYNNNNQLYFEVNANGLTWGNNVAATTEQVETATQTASKYITAVDQNGIKVHAENGTNINYSLISDEGLEIFQGTSVSDTKSIAKFGSTARIGKDTGANTELSNTSIIMFDGQSPILQMSGTGATTRKIDIYKSSESTSAGSSRTFNVDFSDSSATYALYIYHNNQIISSLAVSSSMPTISPHTSSKSIRYDSSTTVSVSTTVGYTKYTGSGQYSASITISGVSAENVRASKMVVFKYYTGEAPHLSFGSRDESKNKGAYSATFGVQLSGQQEDQFVIGKYNDNKTNTVLEVGNGTDNAHSNALTVDWQGNVWAAGAINGLVKHYGAITGATIADKQLTHGTSWQNIGSITLPEGAWLLYLTASFALNGTGYRLLAIADSSAAAGSIIRTNRQAPANGATTSVSINCPLAGGQTYYINGCQNSGTTLKVETRYTAIKIGESFSSY